MANEKLNPPYIAGSLPAIYSFETSTGYVNFSPIKFRMNPTVSIDQVYRVMAKIQTMSGNKSVTFGMKTEGNNAVRHISGDQYELILAYQLNSSIAGH